MQGHFSHVWASSTTLSRIMRVRVTKTQSQPEAQTDQVHRMLKHAPELGVLQPRHVRVCLHPACSASNTTNPSRQHQASHPLQGRRQWLKMLDADL
eukprot:3525528-Rhodomonas_salina.1